MMSYLWGGMIVIGIVYAAFAGNLEAVTDAAIQSAQDAVTLCITMMGVMSMWVAINRTGIAYAFSGSAAKEQGGGIYIP